MAVIPFHEVEALSVQLERAAADIERHNRLAHRAAERARDYAAEIAAIYEQHEKEMDS